MDFLGLFYTENAYDVDTLLDKSLLYESPIPPLDNKFKPFVKFLNRFLNFEAREYDDLNDGEKRSDRQTRWEEEIKQQNECRKEVDKVWEYDKVMDSPINRDGTLSCLFTSILASIREFYNELTEFMIDNKLDSCSEGAYRDLCRSFLKTCGLELRTGDTKKKTLNIGDLDVKSIPDLRCCLRDEKSAAYYFRTKTETVVMIGEVKRWRRNWKLQRSLDFKSHHLQPCNVLGQHGGKLLLETRDTCFNFKKGSNQQLSRLVFGAMAIGTQIVFTALEITEQHLTDIESVKTDKGRVNDEVNVGDSNIFYTRPYDFFKAADRSLLYESLLRLACYQKGFK